MDETSSSRNAVSSSSARIITTEEGKSLLQAMPLESLERFGDALFLPGTMVAIGAWTAPKFHLATAILLTVLLAGLLFFWRRTVEFTGQAHR